MRNTPMRGMPMGVHAYGRHDYEKYAHEKHTHVTIGTLVKDKPMRDMLTKRRICVYIILGGDAAS
jgi:hypothetical protein